MKKKFAHASLYGFLVCVVVAVVSLIWGFPFLSTSATLAETNLSIAWRIVCVCAAVGISYGMFSACGDFGGHFYWMAGFAFVGPGLAFFGLTEQTDIYLGIFQGLIIAFPTVVVFCIGYLIGMVVISFWGLIPAPSRWSFASVRGTVGELQSICNFSRKSPTKMY